MSTSADLPADDDDEPDWQCGDLINGEPVFCSDCDYGVEADYDEED